MRRAWFAAAAMGVAVLAVCPAVGDLPVGSTAPPIEAKEWLNTDQPLSMKDVHGLVVVLYFWESFRDDGEQILGFTSALESNPRLGRSRGVMVIGLTEADKVRAEGMLKKQKIFFPVGVSSGAAKKYQITSLPAFAVIDPNGKIVYCGLPSSANELVGHVLSTVRDTPPKRSHPGDAPKIREGIKSARELLKAGKHRDAFVKAREALELAAAGDPMKTTCLDLIDLIDALGRDQLTKVDPALEGKKYADAARTLKRIAGDFQGLDVSRAAKSRMEALRKEKPEFAKALQADERDGEARAKLFEAQELLRARNFGDAQTELQALVKEFPGTASADAAKRIMQRMEKNPSVSKLVADGVAEEDCKSWLAQGRSFAAQKQMPKAKEMFRKVIDTYPKTSFADQAKEELAKLP